jgi:hypothetical protein
LIVPVDCLLFVSLIIVKALPNLLLGSEFDFCIISYIKKNEEANKGLFY